MKKTNIKLTPLFTQTQILAGIKKLATKLNSIYKQSDRPVALVGILKGCLPFLLELIKHLTFEIILDFMIINSYNGKKNAQHPPQLILNTAINLHKLSVLIIEDIVESGKTVQMAINQINLNQPKDVRVISLLYKPVHNSLFKPDFFVFQAPLNSFLVGFGLDFEEQKRNLTYIGVLNE